MNYELGMKIDLGQRKDVSTIIDHHGLEIGLIYKQENAVKIVDALNGFSIYHEDNKKKRDQDMELIFKLQAENQVLKKQLGKAKFQRDMYIELYFAEFNDSEKVIKESTNGAIKLMNQAVSELDQIRKEGV